MTYVMSDIHGCYDQYLEMLDLIDFKDEDTLFVLGDVVDRGEKPIEVLLDMSMRSNVIPIVGNHEYAAIAIFKQILNIAQFVITEESLDELLHFESKRKAMENLLEDISIWTSDGGEPTYKGFGNLSLEEKKAVVEYLEEFSLFESVQVNGKNYILTHAGVPKGATLENLGDYDAYDFALAHTDYNKVYFEDAILVTGHRPHKSGKVWRGNNHIRIDTGCVFGRNLSCINLETDEEFYVSRYKVDN